jgi:alpha-tubulin suppressor-like RCC1 family protein/plastocyanin
MTEQRHNELKKAITTMLILVLSVVVFLFLPGCSTGHDIFKDGSGTFIVRVRIPRNKSAARFNSSHHHNRQGGERIIPDGFKYLRVVVHHESQGAIEEPLIELTSQSQQTHELSIQVPVGLNTAVIQILDDSTPDKKVLAQRRHGFYMAPGQTASSGILDMGVAVLAADDYEPRNITIPQGTKLYFENWDYGLPHTVILNHSGEGPTYSTGVIAKAENFSQPNNIAVYDAKSITFNEIGTYYYDGIDVSGTYWIVVEEGEAPPPGGDIEFTLTGTVKYTANNGNDYDLCGAWITLSGLPEGEGTFSMWDGNFEISDTVSESQQTLTIKAPGKVPYTRNITLGEGTNVLQDDIVFEDFVGVSGEYYNSFILDKNGHSWGLGENWTTIGMLGIGNSKTTRARTPVQVHSGEQDPDNICTPLDDIIVISTGTHHSIALDKYGYVWAWGDNARGQLGNNSSANNSPFPVQVVSGEQDPDNEETPLKDIIAVSAGYHHNVALDKNGYVWAWGYNRYGQLGNNVSGAENNSSFPVQVISGEQDPDNTETPLKDIIAVAGLYDQIIALDKYGYVWTCGRNLSGQLGNNKSGEENNSSFPVQVVSGEQDPDNTETPLKDIIAVDAGNGFCIALDKYGYVWTWGFNGNGRLGNNKSGTENNSSFPVQVVSGEQDPDSTVTPLEGIIAVSGGRGHSIAVDTYGYVWAWGYNEYGQLGNNEKGSGTDSPFPVQVVSGEQDPDSTVTPLKDIIAVSAVWHSIAIDKYGYVWAWGHNEYGQLGNNESSYSQRSEFPLQVLQGHGPGSDGFINILSQPPGRGIVTGTVENDEEEKLANAEIIIYGKPTAFTNESGVYEITNVPATENTIKASSQGHISSTVSINLESNETFYQDFTLERIDLKDVSAGGDHVLVLRNNGTVWAWGGNYYGQLGNTSVPTGSRLVQVMDDDGGYLTNIIAISAGKDHSLALADDGTIWAWGRNDEGQLGNGNTEDQHTPVKVIHNTDIGKLNIGVTGKLSAGGFHNLALADDGKVWAWGRNTEGQLGNNQQVNGSGLTTTGYSAYPVQVSTTVTGHRTSLTNVISIAAGHKHSLAVYNTEKRVAAWGEGLNGKLAQSAGNNLIDTGNKLTPHEVYTQETGSASSKHGLTGVDEVSAGGEHSLARRGTTEVRSWGINNSHRLGRTSSTSTHYLAAHNVINISGITAISAGSDHSLALDSNKNVWAWGSNTSGQLGNNRGQEGTAWGGTQTSSHPILVQNQDHTAALADINIISAGDKVSTAIDTSNDVLWAWGYYRWSNAGPNTGGASYRLPYMTEW